MVEVEKDYASKGVAGAGLGLGIAGTALGLMQNGNLGGIFGGMAGRACNKKLDNKSANRLFIGILFVIMAICIYNAIKYLSL